MLSEKQKRIITIQLNNMRVMVSNIRDDFNRGSITDRKLRNWLGYLGEIMADTRAIDTEVRSCLAGDKDMDKTPGQ